LSSQITDAINYDIIAEQGIRANVSELANIFPANSVDKIIVSGPQAEFLEQAAIILKAGGRIYINATYSNRYRFGTARGQDRVPETELLQKLSLRLVQVGSREEGLYYKFAMLKFRRSDGGEIDPNKVRTVIYEKVETYGDDR
jgi:hypothetical protein